jgi:biofilm PGA synthesis N-glycosyltransferase PgaC
VSVLFWLSIVLILYTYAVYPGWLFLRTRMYPRHVHRKVIFPQVSILIAVRNEESHLAGKLENLRALNYPKEQIEIAIVSDGSTDRTNNILNASAGSTTRLVILETHVGKAVALNRAMAITCADIVVFMDARQRIGKDSLKALVENFADPAVGCVSGALILGDVRDTSPRGLRSYWEMEKAIRYLESGSGSTVGATGAFYAVRRDLVPYLPEGLILDDLFIPMEVARRGPRVIFEPRALVWDSLPSHPKQEFPRKVRTLFGNYQLLRMAPWLLSAKNPIRFEYISHKLCRLIVPFALIGIILSSCFLSGFYRIPLVMLIGVGALGVLAFVRVPVRILSLVTDMAITFVLLNTAAIVALFYFSVGKKEVWTR